MDRVALLQWLRDSGGWEIVEPGPLLADLEARDLVQVTEQPDGRMIARITGRGLQALKTREAADRLEDELIAFLFTGKGRNEAGND